MLVGHNGCYLWRQPSWCYTWRCCLNIVLGVHGFFSAPQRVYIVVPDGLIDLQGVAKGRRVRSSLRPKSFSAACYSITNASFLKHRDLSPRALHWSILTTGMRSVHGDPNHIQESRLRTKHPDPRCFMLSGLLLSCYLFLCRFFSPRLQITSNLCKVPTGIQRCCKEYVTWFAINIDHKPREQ